jgi:1-acyl-sn-glycerol-3-phosphate acyltransferase
MGERVLRIAAKSVVRALLACLGGVTVIGAENVPDDGGLVVTPNHVSHFDPLVVGMAIRRPVWFLATDELFAIPLLGWLAVRLRAIPIHQDSPDREALRRTEALLEAGEAVVAFPEGHESLDGKLQPLQRGVAWLALRTGVSVLPVGLSGTDGILPPREWRLRHGGRRVIVRIGKPISVAELAGGLSGRASVDHACEVMRQVLEQLSRR